MLLTLGGSRPGATAAAEPAPPLRGCKRVLWFQALAGQHQEAYKAQLRAAISSARRNAPSLIHVLLYEGADDDFTAWYTAQGGILLRHRLSFMPQLEELVAAGIKDAVWLRQHGAYLRLDIPALLEQLRPRADASQGGAQLRRSHLLQHMQAGPPDGHARLRELLQNPDVEPEFVLYTDVDVLLLRDINGCNLPRPAVVAMGAQQNHGQIENSGVLVLNTTSFGAYVPQLVAFGRALPNPFPGSHDQGLLLEYEAAHPGFITPLPDKWNWKPYWGMPSAAAAASIPNVTSVDCSSVPSAALAKGASPALAKLLPVPPCSGLHDIFVLHMHGPKPGKCMQCLVMRAMLDKGTSSCGCAAAYTALFADAYRIDQGRMYMATLLLYQQYAAMAAASSGGGSSGIARVR